MRGIYQVHVLGGIDAVAEYDQLEQARVDCVQRTVRCGGTTYVIDTRTGRVVFRVKKQGNILKA